MEREFRVSHCIRGNGRLSSYALALSGEGVAFGDSMRSGVVRGSNGSWGEGQYQVEWRSRDVRGSARWGSLGKPWPCADGWVCLNPRHMRAR